MTTKEIVLSEITEIKNALKHLSYYNSDQSGLRIKLVKTLIQYQQYLDEERYI